jgi:hypothetical protein
MDFAKRLALSTRKMTVLNSTTRDGPASAAPLLLATGRLPHDSLL